jgi:hypothetical protein
MCENKHIEHLTLGEFGSWRADHTKINKSRIYIKI